MRQKRKSIHTGKEELKLALLTYNTILQNVPMDARKELLELQDSHRKVAGNKVNIHKENYIPI